MSKQFQFSQTVTLNSYPEFFTTSPLRVKSSDVSQGKIMNSNRTKLSQSSFRQSYPRRLAHVAVARKAINGSPGLLVNLGLVIQSRL